MPASPASPAAAPDRAALSALVIGSTLLAFGPLLVRLSENVAGVGPLTSAFWRMALAAPVLAAVALLHRRREGASQPVFRALPWAAATLAGLFFALDLATWHLGIVRTSTANATLLGNTAAFMLAGWAILVQKQRPAPSTARALILAGLGALLLLGHSAQLSGEHLAGDLLSLCAAAFYTAYLLVVMRLRGSLPTSTVLAMSTLASVLFLAPAALAEPGQLLPGTWWPVVTLAITSQLAGQGLMVFASGRLPAGVIAIGLLVQPLVSAAAGWIVFAEALGPVELLGGALVAAALVLVRR